MFKLYGEIGDGSCDGFLNNKENRYDGGDCCGEDANMDFCHNGVCECVDPNHGRVLDFGLSIDSQFESHPWHLIFLPFYKCKERFKVKNSIPYVKFFLFVCFWEHLLSKDSGYPLMGFYLMSGDGI